MRQRSPTTPDISYEEARETIIRFARESIDPALRSEKGIIRRHNHPLFKKEFTLKDSKCPVYIVRVPRHPTYPAHEHLFTNITVILKGLGVYVVDGHPYDVSEGDVLILRKGHIHSTQTPEALSVLNVCFDEKLIGLRAREFVDAPGYKALFEVEPQLRKKKEVFRHKLRLNTKQLAKVEGMAKTIEEEIQTGSPGYPSIVRAEMIELITLLCRWYSCGQNEARHARRLSGALLFLEKNPFHAHSMHDLARMSGFSLRQFFRIFRMATNQSPGEYLRNLRLRHASELLQDPSMNITEVAFACGFNDSNYFCRAFKKFSGRTPSDYKSRKETSD